MRIRLSYSSMLLYQSCPRKFQKLKLLLESPEQEESASLIFGKAFGAAAAEFFVTRSRDKAIFKFWLDYWPVLEASSKTRLNGLLVLEEAFPVWEKILDEWEVATFNNQPAVELGFRLDLPSSFGHEIYYVGYLDIVLKHRREGHLAALDFKTSGLRLLDLSPVYRNSSQMVGYGIILDEVAKQLNLPTTYEVIYAVSRTMDDRRTEIYSFQKKLLTRLNFLVDLMEEVEGLEKRIEEGFFPLRGSACLSWARPCQFFGSCEHSLGEKTREESVGLPEKEFQFRFKLEDILEDYMSRDGKEERRKVASVGSLFNPLGSF